MGVYGKIQVAALALLLASAGARAGGTAVLKNYAPDGTPAWVDNPDSMECGIKCIYLESVEKISVRSRHTIETLKQMKDIDPANKNDKAAQAEMNEIIPDMCDFNGNSGKPETVRECQYRWFKVQIPTLYQDKLAIKYNTSSAASLESDATPAINVNGVAMADPSKSADRAPPGLFLNSVPGDFTPKAPVVTSMEQYNDIRDRALKNTSSLRISAAMVQQIEKTTGVYHEEFVRTREILKDPSDPKAGTYSIVLTNPDGTPQYDNDAFNKAVENRKKLLTLEPEEKLRLEANLKDLRVLHQKQLTGTAAAAGKRERIYTAVRSSILGAAKRALVKLKMIGPSAPKPQTVKGPKPAAQALSRAATGPGGAAVDNVDPASSKPNTGDDQDIIVPPTARAGSRPYVTVGYSDNVLGGEILRIENDFAGQRGITLDK